MNGMTKQDKAVKKVEIAIDKLIDLQQDLIKDDYVRTELQRILDSLNSLRNSIYQLDNNTDFYN